MMRDMRYRWPGRGAVIADDFTGAMDTGVHLLTGGSRPFLRIMGDTPLRPTKSAGDDTLVVDTETRHLSAREAYDRVKSVASELVAAGYRPFFKKIDSTYRGNVGAEIDAMLDLLGYPAAAVVSAVPAAGRTVRDGICLVRGIPLHESESGADPLSPHATSSTQEIVASQSTRKSILIDQRLTQQPPMELAGELARHIALGAEILLFDAASDADIQRIVHALVLVPEPLLLVGAAGLAAALGRDSPNGFVPAGSGPPVGTGDGFAAGTDRLLGTGPGLFVSGSLMRTTAEQVERLAGHTDRVGSIALRPNAVVSEPGAESDRIVNRAVALAQSGRHILLRTTTRSLDTATSRSKLAPNTAVDIARFVAQCTRRIVDSSPVDTLILTGGSTAVAVMQALGVADLRIMAEVESGLPVCDAELSGHDRSYRIVTKAGGFGRVDSFERIMEMMDRAAARGSSEQ